MSNVAHLEYRVIITVDGKDYIHLFPSFGTAQSYANWYRTLHTVRVQSRQIGPWANEPLS